MILKHDMTDDEILNEIKHEMKQKEIKQTDKNTKETMEIAKQILENTGKHAEIEFVLQRGLQNDAIR